jgi:hypothetical protein
MLAMLAMLATFIAGRGRGRRAADVDLVSSDRMLSIHARL